MLTAPCPSHHLRAPQQHAVASVIVMPPHARSHCKQRTACSSRSRHALRPLLLDPGLLPSSSPIATAASAIHPPRLLLRVLSVVLLQTAPSACVLLGALCRGACCLCSCCPLSDAACSILLHLPSSPSLLRGQPVCVWDIRHAPHTLSHGEITTTHVHTHTHT